MKKEATFQNTTKDLKLCFRHEVHKLWTALKCREDCPFIIQGVNKKKLSFTGGLRNARSCIRLDYKSKCKTYNAFTF